MTLINQDLSGSEAQEGFEVLPIGWYDAQVIDSEIKEGPRGDYVNWTYQIIGKSNKVWDVMSFSNEVAMNRLKSLAVACDHHNPNFIADTEELHGRKFRVRLKIEEDETGRYDAKNKATGFKSINNDSPAKIPTRPTQAQPTQGQTPILPIPSATVQHQSSAPRMPWQK